MRSHVRAAFPIAGRLTPKARHYGRAFLAILST